MATSYSPEQMEEISTRLLDLHQCLTTKLIGLELRVSRSVACQLLEDFLAGEERKGKDFCVARYVRQKEEGGKTVIKLETSKVTTPCKPTDKKNEGAIYSITLLQPSSSSNSLQQYPQKAQQSTSASLTDLLSRDLSAAFDSKLRCFEIQSKQEVYRRDVGSVRGSRVAAMSSSSFGALNAAVKREPKPTLSSGNEKRKVTTAASFFAARGGGSKAKKETAKKVDVKKEETKKHEMKKGKISDRRVIDDDEDSDEEMKDTVNEETKKKSTEKPKDKSQEEDNNDSGKENKSQKNTKKKTTKKRKTKAEKEAEHSYKVQNYGTADDFIGDQDEDEEYLQQEEERRKRNALAARKQVRKEAEDESALRRNRSTFKEHQRRRAVPRSEDDDGNEEDDAMDVDEEGNEREEKEQVYGEMDSFLQRCKDQEEQGESQKDGQQHPTKKRRKVLREKTSMGADGYLHTETVTEYEDVPDNEVEEEKKESSRGDSYRGGGGGSSMMQKKKTSGAAKSGAGAQKKNMKQTGLMGFFAPKKK